MANAIPIVFTASGGQQYQKPFVGYAGIWVNPQGKVMSPDYQTDYTKSPNNWALVLDRNDPTKPPLFVGNLDSNTDVPTAFGDAVAKESLLFYVFAGNNAQVPQGALFTLLEKCGAGGELQKLERLAYYNGCGMLFNSAYCLVATPNTGLSGIEKSDFQIYGATYASPAVTVTTGIAFKTLLTMVPGSNGYMPVEVG